MEHRNEKFAKKKGSDIHRQERQSTTETGRRVFIAIRINGNALETLTELERRLPPIPMRKIPKHDMHITLVPPWTEKDVAGAAKRLGKVLKGVLPFSLKLKHLEYGPTPGNPRLIWVRCEASKQLIELNERLRDAFGVKQKGETYFPFTPHVTIARLVDPDEGILRKHHLTERVPVAMYVEAIELLQSPHQGGVGYKTLKRVRFSRT